MTSDKRPNGNFQAATEACAVGRDPRCMSVAELEAVGHRKRPLLQAIRESCIECAGGSPAEVRRCDVVQCPTWPYRMGTNPFNAERSPGLRAAAAERMRGLRAKQGRQGENSNEIDCLSDATISAGGEVAAEVVAPLAPYPQAGSRS